MNALAAAHDGAVRMIDTFIVRVPSTRRLHRSQQETVHGPVATWPNRQDTCGAYRGVRRSDYKKFLYVAHTHCIVGVWFATVAH